jgi:redox-sensitive bicupin YhaK (pirin superfamily)
VSSLDPDPEGLGGERSPAVVRAPLAGLQVALPSGGNVTLATRADFEYGVMAADRPVSVTFCNSEASGAFGTVGASDADATGRAHGTQFGPGVLAHLPPGSNEIQLPALGPSRFMVVGGMPPGERLVVWWNFVAASG